MKINSTKTEVMVCSKDFENNDIQMVDNALQQVSKFKYLGSTCIITEDEKIKKT